MALKCMEFCQALTSQGMMFSFNLTTGTGFSFSLDTKESEKPASAVAEQAKKKKKKLSPSDVRRNQRRRQEFLKRKSEGRKDESSNVLQTPEKERAPRQVVDLRLRGCSHITSAKNRGSYTPPPTVAQNRGS